MTRGAAFIVALGALLCAPASGIAGPHRENDAKGLPAQAPRPRIACNFPDREDSDLPEENAPFDVLVAGPGNVGLSVSNFGSIGNDHDSRDASFEFPNGSEIEHLIRGGIWIGGVTADGDTFVSTASLDQNIASAGDVTTEYVPARAFLRRSSLINDRNFDPEAISEEDYITAYRDFPASDTSGFFGSCPLGIEVEQTVLGWSFRPVDDFVIINYRVKNVSTVALDRIYVGMFAEFATNFKGRYEEWPPTPVGQLFDHKVIDWSDSLRLFSERHCDFDGGDAPTIAGMKLLGSRPEPIAEKTVSFNWFDFFPNDPSRDEDRERYLLLGNGQSDSTEFVSTTCDGGQTTNDPIEVVSAGPYLALLPGDTLSFTFALVGGDNRSDLELNAGWAQQAFDANYIIPEPPPSPGVFVDPGPQQVTLYWDDIPETAPDPASGELDFQGYRVYLSGNDLSFDVVRDIDKVDTVGFNTGFAAVEHDTMIAGKSYQYRLTIPALRDGFQHWVSITSYDLGSPSQGLPSLESGIPQNKVLFVPGGEAAPHGSGRRVTVYPNPYGGQADWDGNLPRERLIWFNHLPERCVIRIFTLSGDLVDEIRFDGVTYSAEGNFLLDRPDEDPPRLSGGQAAWDLLSKEDQPIASGLYLFAVEDLATGEHSTGKFVVLK